VGIVVGVVKQKIKTKHQQPRGFSGFLTSNAPPIKDFDIDELNNFFAHYFLAWVFQFNMTACIGVRSFGLRASIDALLHRHCPKHRIQPASSGNAYFLWYPNIR
jgi:hypothetical protein